MAEDPVEKLKHTEQAMAKAQAILLQIQQQTRVIEQRMTVINGLKAQLKEVQDQMK